MRVRARKIKTGSALNVEEKIKSSQVKERQKHSTASPIPKNTKRRPTDRPFVAVPVPFGDRQSSNEGFFFFFLGKDRGGLFSFTFGDVSWRLSKSCMVLLKGRSNKDEKRAPSQASRDI